MPAAVMRPHCSGPTGTTRASAVVGVFPVGLLVAEPVGELLGVADVADVADEGAVGVVPEPGDPPGAGEVVHAVTTTQRAAEMTTRRTRPG
jgi:hypothetical protein